MSALCRRPVRHARTGGFRSFLIGVFALLVAASAAIADNPGQRLPVFRIEAENKRPVEQGAELGRQVKERFPDLEARYDSYLADTFTQGQFDTWLSGRVEPLRATAIDPAYLAELQGLAGALSLIGRNRLGDGYLSLDELWFLQLIPDIGGHTGGWGFGVYGTRSATGGALIGRNLDRSGNPALRGLQAITVYAGANHSVVNIGFAGISSLVTGFNDSGLFLALLDATPTPGQSQPIVATGAIGFDLRRALETQDGGVTGAVRTLGRRRYGADHSVLLAGPKRVQVLEHPHGQPARLRKASTPTRPEMAWDRPDQIAAVGCFALPTSPAGCHQLRERYRWQRLRALARFEPEGPHARVADLAHIALDRSNSNYALFARSTLQSMVFDPQQQVLQLYAAPSDGWHPEDPGMQRYASLAVNSKGKANGVVTEISSIWLVLAILAAILAYARWRRW